MKLPPNTFHMPIHHPISMQFHHQRYHVFQLMLITCIPIQHPTKNHRSYITTLSFQSIQVYIPSMATYYEQRK